jgi:hypothetical protein
MGKRELLIAAAFIVLGAIVYQFTAPPPKEGERSFSIGRIIDGFKREMREDSAQADFTQSGTIAVAADAEELRVNISRGVAVTIEGGDRPDIAYEMPVRSTGPDVASALENAKKSIVEIDDLGRQITVGTYFPPEGRQTASLTLKVPSRLMVRIESGGRPNVRGVAALHLGRTSGELTAEDIRDAVAGTHQSGEITIRNAGTVDLTVVSAQTRLTGIARGISLNARSGTCEVAGSGGPLEFTGTSTRLTVTGHDGPIEIGGDGGRIQLVRPAKSVHVDIRRAEVEATLDAAVPVTILTSDQPLRLVLEGALPVEIDAIANHAAVDASALGLEAVRTERAARLTHAFGDRTVRIVLRNSRGDIVLARAK